MIPPSYYEWAKSQVGVREIPGPKTNETISRTYRELAKTPLKGDDGEVPWCAIFVNAALEISGVRGSRSAMAKSFAQKPDDFRTMHTPFIGCIVVLHRTTAKSPLGHVGFYWGEDKTHVYLLGGNQNDQVNIARFPKSRIMGYYYPRSLPVPPVEGRQVFRTPGNIPSNASMV